MNLSSNNLKISIIVAVFNGEATLQRCIDSVAKQTYPNVELVIIDGCSTDGTVDIIRKNHDDIFYWESKLDRGIAHAWNKGVERATGDWLYFLGADDCLCDCNVIKTFVSYIGVSHKEPLIFYGSVTYCDAGKTKRLGDPWEIASKNLSVGMCIPHQGMFHSKDLFSQCGGFDEHFHIASDYHLMMKSLKFSKPVFIEDLLVSDMYAGGLSTCRCKRWIVLNEFREIQKEMGVPISSRWVFHQILAQFFRVLRKK